MLSPDELKAALERLVAGTDTEADRQALQRVLVTQQIILASGKQAVAVGGDMTDAVITTGDGNVVCIFKGLDAQAVRKIVQHILESFTLRTLLTPAEFSARAEQAAFASHQAALVGREAVLEQVKVY